MIKGFFTGFIAFLLPFILFAQPKELVNYDYNYSDEIKTVILRPLGFNNGFPITFLNSGQPLEMIFDDLNGDFTYYKYRIVQCDANWNPSSLNELEYLEGFNDQEIRDYAYSVNTRVVYTQYVFSFPNDLVGVTKSGNYLIHVYKEEDNSPVITRRFVVSDQMFGISAEIVGDLRAGSVSENQRIDLTISPKIKIIDPLTQVRVAILKNGIWENKPLIAPKFVRNDKLLYDYINETSFPAGKEFRYLDLRSMRRPSFKVENLERYDDRTEVFLRNDDITSRSGNIAYPDLNGSFIIESLDNTNDLMESAYCQVHFYLKAEAPLPNPVYVMGQFNEWGNNVSSEPMTYVPEKKYYTTTILMKQGYYDYFYAEKLKNGSFDHTNIEGNDYQTSNNYQIIVYYKGYGERYERVGQYWLLGVPSSGIYGGAK